MLVVAGRWKYPCTCAHPSVSKGKGKNAVKSWPWAARSRSNVCFTRLGGSHDILNAAGTSRQQDQDKAKPNNIFHCYEHHTNFRQCAHFQGWTDIFPDFLNAKKLLTVAAHLILRSKAHSDHNLFRVPVLAGLSVFLLLTKVPWKPYWKPGVETKRPLFLKGRKTNKSTKIPRYTSDFKD